MGGKLIGIVNAKEASEGIEGLGFAIPINRVEKAIEDIISGAGYVKDRPTLSVAVSYGTMTFRGEGLYVVEVMKSDSPFKVGDRIVSIGGTEISSVLDYNVVVSGLQIGSTVTVSVFRDRSLIDLNVNVIENTAIQ